MTACPICHSESICLKRLTPVFLKSGLAAYFNDRSAMDLSIPEYTLMKCPKCRLEFASPMKAGDEKFYAWITSHAEYYTNYRWEWGVVIEERLALEHTPIQLLEVECGSGKFLDMLAASNPKANAVGLDTESSSVDFCRKKGLDVHCGTIDSFFAARSSMVGCFTHVAAFHCLEHVEDPVGFIRSMLAALAPGGRIFVSTPYSPLFFETMWFDPMNHPPHHMTRWNFASYAMMANRLGLKYKIFMPSAKSVWSRTLSSLIFAWGGHRYKISNKQLLVKGILNSRLVFYEFIRQLGREKLNKRVAANVILFELYR